MGPYSFTEIPFLIIYEDVMFYHFNVFLEKIYFRDWVFIGYIQIAFELNVCVSVHACVYVNKDIFMHVSILIILVWD